MTNTFSPTPAELTVVSQIFASADPQKLGVLTGDVAVRVLEGAKLPPTVLGEIWNISDEDNKGWLPKKGVAIAVRLIGWAQKGEKITQALVNKPGPLAVIEGITPVTQHNTGISLPRSPPPGFPPLTPQDKARFQAMFSKHGPANGLLSGEKARDIFVKSKLSNEQLLKIWNLADTQDRGALDGTDFAIGMYFIQGVMTGKISFVPTTLPPGLYQQAGGVGNAGSVRSHLSGNSGSFSPVGSTFPPQHTGQSQMLQQDYTGLSGSSRSPNLPARPNPSVLGNGGAHDWDITPSEKASSDSLFATLDSQKHGYIEGDVAVPFMLKSQLPGEILAQVWDLADISNDGRLTKDGFAIAMHLIQKKLAGKEIPVVLPPSLIPPSMRATRAAALGPSPFSPAPHVQTHQQPEPVVDLFSFDDTPPSSATAFAPPTNLLSSVKPQSTGSAARGLSPPPKRTRETDPFSSSPFQTSPHQDFLSDDDHHGTASPPLQDQSAEIGNLRNMTQSTSRALSSAREEREALEQTLANQASLLSTLQTQLSSAKAAYETETSLLATLKERRSTQLSDIQTTREELIRAESDLSAVRVEKAEMEGAFLRDKEEARDLHKRMIEAGQQAEALKADVEKLKKEAKQQKGLLAIARKQLSTKETEKAKAEKEHEEAVVEVASVTREKDGVEAEIANLDAVPEPRPVHPASPSDSLFLAAAQPLPMTPDLTSTPVKSNNPFERLAMSSGQSTPRSQSPFLALAGTIISTPPVASSPPISNIATSAPLNLPVENGNGNEASQSTDSHETDLFYLADEQPSVHGPESVLSPNTGNGTEYFMTPPTSANEASTNPKERFPSLDELPPPVQFSTPSSTLAQSAASLYPNAETDLTTQLKEMDVEDSDSDDETDDDNVPLASLPAANGHHIHESPVRDLEPVPVPKSNDSFDDVFGSDEPKEVTHNNGNAALGLPAPVPDISNHSVAPNPVKEVAGVNEFDETLGKLHSTTTTPATFSFDSAFDDNFDFTSASKATELPKTEQTDFVSKTDFDDAFGASAAGPTTQPVGSQSTTTVTNHIAPKFESSFEEAFKGFDSVTAPKLDDQPSLVSSPTAMATENMSVPGSFPISPATAPPVPPPSKMRSPSPPPRDRSPPPPPPRMASPKPRVSSSSSSKEVAEKPKEPAPRHSKLSLRLPFGKKKKQQEPMPPPPSHLTPPVEHPHRMATPASEDDVEAVKQLTAMGFSRSQAVDALEKYGYDVQKALNSLLGAQ